MKSTAASDAMKKRKSSSPPAMAATRCSATLLILPAGRKESRGFSGADDFRGSEMIGFCCSDAL
ncbi:MAG: hypothetical protein WCY41_02825 [Candidatus Micrarchaeia archaeon]